MEKTDKGVYCLILFLCETCRLEVGKLGIIEFPKGYYCYVGSAMNSLKKRIERHLRGDKRVHWHIDYLLEVAHIEEVLKFKTSERIECFLSKKLYALSDGFIKDFGSSDCGCRTHLYYFTEYPIERVSYLNLYELEVVWQKLLRR
ncbi:MAG: DUF123 domain-containing protein [Candidatus Methanofastidiosia archaeon]